MEQIELLVQAFKHQVVDFDQLFHVCGAAAVRFSLRSDGLCFHDLLLALGFQLEIF